MRRGFYIVPRWLNTLTFAILSDVLPDRLTVGQRPLKPLIGVRIPVGQLGWYNNVMNKMLLTAWLIIMIAIIVGVDLLFFRDRLWERLIANIGIVLLCVAFYLRFFK
jgi:hypothetical protein